MNVASLKEKWETLLKVDDEHPFSAGRLPTGGVRRTLCRKCGGTVGPSGFGVIRDTCGKCGEVHHEPRYA